MLEKEGDSEMGLEFQWELEKEAGEQERQKVPLPFPFLTLLRKLISNESDPEDAGS